jgi:hypothetical protein
VIGLQQLAVDVIVAAAALWLAWSFGPEGLRRAVLRRRRVRPAYDVALHADALDGRSEDTPCGPDCGCG